jgi:hypothetical protein
MQNLKSQIKNQSHDINLIATIKKEINLITNPT